MQTRIGYLTRVAVLGAAAAVLMVALESRLPFFPDYLKYDPGDLPALLAGLAMGPAAGLWVELIKGLLFLASGRATTGLVGVGANLLAGSALVLAACWLHRLGGKPGSWLSRLGVLAGGPIAMAAVMVPANALFFLPLWGVPAEQVWTVALSVVPFNLVKGLLSGALSLALYQRLGPWLKARPVLPGRHAA